MVAEVTRGQMARWPRSQEDRKSGKQEAMRPGSPETWNSRSQEATMLKGWKAKSEHGRHRQPQNTTRWLTSAISNIDPKWDQFLRSGKSFMFCCSGLFLGLLPGAAKGFAGDFIEGFSLIVHVLFMGSSNVCSCCSFDCCQIYLALMSRGGWGVFRILFWTISELQFCYMRLFLRCSKVCEAFFLIIQCKWLFLRYHVVVSSLCYACLGHVWAILWEALCSLNVYIVSFLAKLFHMFNCANVVVLHLYTILKI